MKREGDEKVQRFLDLSKRARALERSADISLAGLENATRALATYRERLAHWAKKRSSVLAKLHLARQERDGLRKELFAGRKEEKK